MQWLIDIIKEWIQAQGYLTTSFVDRGDPTKFDFTKVNFTVDGGTYVLDLSAIVPEGAKAVLFFLTVMATDANKLAFFRKHGNANWYNVSRATIHASALKSSYDMVCPISSDRKLDYRFEVTTWLEINFVVKGWWL